MAKCKRVLRCYHCGSILQKDDPEAPGYISPESFERPKPIQILYCDHCFEIMKSFNNSALDYQIDNDILRVLDDAIATDALILWVIDLFSFNGTLNPDLAKKVSKLKVVVLGNKFDLLPERTNKEGLKSYLRERFNEYGVNPIEVKIIGNADKTDFRQLLAELHNARQGHDVYMVGDSSSGKTTLINRTLKNYVNKTHREIKTSKYEDTDVNILEIPFSRSSFMYELPGISQTTSTVSMVEKDVQKIIIPKKTAKVYTKTLLPGETIILGSLGAFSLISGKPLQLKLYCAEGVEAKKVLTKNASLVMEENMKKKTLRPVSDRFRTFLDFDMFDYSMEKDGKMHDIGIQGFCWISFKAGGQVIRTISPKGAAIKECLAKIR